MEAMRTFVFGPVQTSDGPSIDYVYSCAPRSCAVYPGAAGSGRDDGASLVVYA
jgi:hypothetical protein